MVLYKISSETLTSFADALRSKILVTGSLLFPDDFITQLAEAAPYTVITGGLTSLNWGGSYIISSYFIGQNSLSQVKLSYVKTVGIDAFKGCTALQAVDLPQVTSLGSNAFYGCTRLYSIKLGPQVPYSSSNTLNHPLIYTQIWDGMGNIYIPSSAWSTYMNDSTWNMLSDCFISY